MSVFFAKRVCRDTDLSETPFGGSLFSTAAVLPKGLVVWPLAGPARLNGDLSSDPLSPPLCGWPVLEAGCFPDVCAVNGFSIGFTANGLITGALSEGAACIEKGFEDGTVAAIGAVGIEVAA